MLAALSLAHSNSPLNNATQSEKRAGSRAHGDAAIAGDARPSQSQGFVEEEAPQREYKAIKKPRKGRHSQVSLVKHAIAKKVSWHPDEVQKFLNALDEVAMEFLETKGVLRLHFVTVKLRTIPAREATQKRVFGKDYTVAARPARRSLKLTAAKCLKQLCR